MTTQGNAYTLIKERLRLNASNVPNVCFDSELVSEGSFDHYLMPTLSARLASEKSEIN